MRAFAPNGVRIVRFGVANGRALVRASATVRRWTKARQALSGQSARIAVAPATLAPLTRANAGELPTSRDLLVQALLYLPRLAHADGTVSFSDATDEIERLRTLRAYELAPLRALAAAPEEALTLTTSMFV